MLTIMVWSVLLAPGHRFASAARIDSTPFCRQVAPFPWRNEAPARLASYFASEIREDYATTSVKPAIGSTF